METKHQFLQAIRDIPNFPKEGIVFKDIMPVFADATLTKKMILEIGQELQSSGATKIAGLESRGFLIGAPLALSMELPFVCVRKKGKLPGVVLRKSYDLEYGQSEIEIQADAFGPSDRVIIHDDVLATGGTALAAKELIESTGAKVIGFSFLMEVELLKGREKLVRNDAPIYTFATV
jgi:adenine phosphoribosyltransferase